MANHLRSKNHITRIISLLKELKYDGLPIMEENFVRSALLLPGCSRSELLVWVEEQLLPQQKDALCLDPIYFIPNSTMYFDPNSTMSVNPSSTMCLNMTLNTTICPADQFNPRKLTKKLSQLGLCQQQDLDVIEGSASPGRQLVFWLRILESIVALKKIHAETDSRNMSHESNVMMTQIAGDSQLLMTLKPTGFSLLPDDLWKGYRNWKKSGDKINLEDELINTNYKLSEALTNVSELECPANAIDQMAIRLASLNTAAIDFDAKCKDISKLIPKDSKKDLGRTGELVNITSEKVSNLCQFLHGIQKSTKLSKSMKDPATMDKIAYPIVATAITDICNAIKLPL